MKNFFTFIFVTTAVVIVMASIAIPNIPTFGLNKSSSLDDTIDNTIETVKLTANDTANKANKSIEEIIENIPIENSPSPAIQNEIKDFNISENFLFLEVSTDDYLNLPADKRILILEKKISECRIKRDEILANKVTAEKNNRKEITELLTKELTLNESLETFYAQEVNEIRQETVLEILNENLRNSKDETLDYLLENKKKFFTLITLLIEEINKEKNQIKLINLQLEDLNDTNIALEKNITDSETARDIAIVAYNTNATLKLQDELTHKKNIAEIETNIALQNKNINNQLIKNLKTALEISLTRVSYLEKELNARKPKSKITEEDKIIISNIIEQNSATLINSIQHRNAKLAICEKHLANAISEKEKDAGNPVKIEEVRVFNICTNIYKDALNLVEDGLLLNKIKADIQRNNLKITARQAYYDELLAMRRDLEKTIPYIDKIYQTRTLQAKILKVELQIAELKSHLTDNPEVIAALNKQIDFYRQGLENYDVFLRLATDLNLIAKKTFDYCKSRTKDAV